jgi:NADH dehydrogenase/NADH:ubiquinone oxidoreductase subunit G
MDDITLTINGAQVAATPGETVLDVAKRTGTEIPTLCHHKDLLPHGSCRLCLVELKAGSRSQLVASCGYYVKKGLVVETTSPRVLRARKLVLELLLAFLHRSPQIQEYAIQNGVTSSRYDRSLAYCVLCGLCVRYCEEIKKADCLGFVGRGVDRDVAWTPLARYDDNCKTCMECQHLCPTGVFPSNLGMASPLPPLPQGEG